MVDVDNLSDAELRSKLLEFGFPVMPITGTTRKTMTKKLKMLLENKNKINKDNRRSLGRYSSEDESDSDTKTAKRDKYKRATMAAPLMQPPSAKKKPAKADSVESPVRKEVKTSTTTTRTMKILHSAKDEFDTGSESDEVAEKYSSIPSYRRDSPTKSPSLSESFKKTPSPARLPASFISASSAADAASDRISQIRSRLSQYNSGYDKPYYTPPTEDLLKDKENTPFLSNFTKRLSQLSESPKSPSFDYKSDIIKENDVNGGATSSRAYLNRAARGRPSAYDYKLTNQNIFKNNFVPFMVLVVAFLFFIVVAVVYLGIRSDTSLEVTDGAEFTSSMVVGDMDQVNEGRRSKVTALMARHPYIPWKCYFYNTLWTFLSILTSILGGVVILYIFNTSFKYYKQMRQKQQEEEVAMVEQIIDILQTNSAESEDNYMVINHVRDMILPIHDRKNKQKIWAKAVKYIDENESRIRTEVQVVRGEPSEVWRWLGGASLSTSKNKSWQGQAFETQVGSVNSLPCSPTPCLKIRGMVEEGDRNTHVIKKAVLSKCAQQCRILHCAIDTSTNCVYLKCADPSDAAVAYRNLHGW
ncbi:inner nuclear membrane protein Man1, partial [Asbolus verrucosus]